MQEVIKYSLSLNEWKAVKYYLFIACRKVHKKSKILLRELDVGGNLLTLQTFHYPASNLVAPRNAKQQTFIDASDMPLLFSYEFKTAYTVVVKQVRYT